MRPASLLHGVDAVLLPFELAAEDVSPYHGRVGSMIVYLVVRAAFLDRVAAIYDLRFNVLDKCMQ